MTAKLYIYRNLHLENTFSIRHRGRVIDRQQNFLARNVTFKVNEAGRQRVLTERRKNVHAFVVAESYEPIEMMSLGLNRLSYNPYRGPTFTLHGEPIFKAELVLFEGGHCHLVK